MKKFAILRETTPPKLLGTAAFLLSASASILVAVEQDAGAMNHNIVQAGPGVAAPILQQSFGPFAINILRAVDPIVAPVAKPPGYKYVDPVRDQEWVDWVKNDNWAPVPEVPVVKLDPALKPELKLDYLLKQKETHDQILFPKLPEVAKGEWNGEGGLRRPFVAPWYFATSKERPFDPNFYGPGWDSIHGFTSGAALFNLAGTDAGKMMFDRGLFYAGKATNDRKKPFGNQDSNAVDWDGRPEDGTAALFPERDTEDSTAGGARAAL